MAKLWTLVRRDGEMVISTSSALTDFQEGREVVIVFFEIVTSRSPCFQPGRIYTCNKSVKQSVSTSCALQVESSHGPCYNCNPSEFEQKRSRMNHSSDSHHFSLCLPCGAKLKRKAREKEFTRRDSQF